MALYAKIIALSVFGMHCNKKKIFILDISLQIQLNDALQLSTIFRTVPMQI